MSDPTKVRIVIGTMSCGLIFLMAQAILNPPEDRLTRLLLVVVLVQLAVVFGALLQMFTETQ